jgi:hypothetical protein
MEKMAKLKNGQIKDFTWFNVYYISKYGDDDIAKKIFSASVMCEMKNLSKKEERAIMYDPSNQWLSIIQSL